CQLLVMTFGFGFRSSVVQGVVPGYKAAQLNKVFGGFRMKGLFVFGFFMLATAAFADQLTPPPVIFSLEPWCAYSYRSDSYGRGLEAGFIGGDLRPARADEGCY